MYYTYNINTLSVDSKITSICCKHSVMYFKSASGSKEPSRFKMSSHIPVNHKKKQGSLYSNFKRIHPLNLYYRTATILSTDGWRQWRQHHNIMWPLNYFCSCIKTKSINKFLTHNSLFIFRLSNKKSLQPRRYSLGPIIWRLQFSLGSFCLNL